MRSFLGLVNYPNRISPHLAENGIQVYNGLQGCISMLPGGNFQECHTSLLQS